MNENQAAEKYDSLPQITKDYADFVCNMLDLQKNIGLHGVMALEDARRDLHEKMAEHYGLRYEYTRTATAEVYLAPYEMTPERVAIAVDWNLRYVKGLYEQARTDNKLDEFEKDVDEMFHPERKNNEHKSL